MVGFVFSFLFHRANTPVVLGTTENEEASLFLGEHSAIAFRAIKLRVAELLLDPVRTETGLTSVTQMRGGQLAPAIKNTFGLEVNSFGFTVHLVRSRSDPGLKSILQIADKMTKNMFPSVLYFRYSSINV